MSRKSNQHLSSKQVYAVVSALAGMIAAGHLWRHGIRTSKLVGISVWRYAGGKKVTVRSDLALPAPPYTRRFLPAMHKRVPVRAKCAPLTDAGGSHMAEKAARLRETIDRNAAAWSEENASLIASLKAQIRPRESSAFRWVDPAPASVPVIDGSAVAQLLGAERI